MKNSIPSAVKKVEDGCPPHSAAAAEAEIYESNCKKLMQLGVNVADPEIKTFGGMQTDFYPRVVLSPSFALTFADLKVCVSFKLHTAGNSLLWNSGEILRSI